MTSGLSAKRSTGQNTALLSIRRWKPCGNTVTRNRPLRPKNCWKISRQTYGLNWKIADWRGSLYETRPLSLLRYHLELGAYSYESWVGKYGGAGPTRVP